MEPTTTIIVQPELDVVLTKMARAGVRHPINLSKDFLGSSVQFTFSMGVDGETPTLTLGPTGTHTWPHVSEPTKTFDDRELG